MSALFGDLPSALVVLGGAMFLELSAVVALATRWGRAEHSAPELATTQEGTSATCVPVERALARAA